MSEHDHKFPVQEGLRTSQAVNKVKKASADYSKQLEQDFSRVFETLTLTDLQKEFLRSRWLNQMLWMAGRAARARNWYYRLRLTTIIGGVIVPILVSLNIANRTVDSALKSATIFLSGLVAVSSAVEEFFHYGERWRHYRRTTESLKAQGWQFFELTGPYQSYKRLEEDKRHEEAFSVFADQVEEIIQRDVEVYATQVVQERKQEEGKQQQT